MEILKSVPSITVIRLGCIGFGLHLHRRMVGLKLVQLTYDYTSTANSKRKYNLPTVRQLAHRHLNAFEACLEGRLQLVVLRCIGLAWPFFPSTIGSSSYSPAGSPPFTISAVTTSSVSLPGSLLKPLPQTDCHLLLYHLLLVLHIFSLILL